MPLISPVYSWLKPAKFKFKKKHKRKHKKLKHKHNQYQQCHKQTDRSGKPARRIVCSTGEVVNSYREYLHTNHWRNLKKRYFSDNSTDHCCFYCGFSIGLNLHHKTYKRLGHENLDDLILLCQEHHEKLHEYIKEHPDKPKDKMWPIINNKTNYTSETYLLNNLDITDLDI